MKTSLVHVSYVHVLYTYKLVGVRSLSVDFSFDFGETEQANRLYAVGTLYQRIRRYRTSSSFGIKSCNTSSLSSPFPSPFPIFYPLFRYIFLFLRVSYSLCSSNPPTLIFFSSFPLKAARSNPGTAQPAQRYYAVRLIDTRWIERTRVSNGVPRTSEGCKQTDG